MTDPIEQACFWLARRAPGSWTELARPEEADVAIVGAGLTGLWTALSLKALEPALEVAVIEQGLAAHGASGRNVGYAVGNGRPRPRAGRPAFRRGGGAGSREARRGQYGGDDGYLDARGTRCDYEPTGRLMVALTQAQVVEARRAVETAHALGLGSFDLLDAEAYGQSCPHRSIWAACGSPAAPSSTR